MIVKQTKKQEKQSKELLDKLEFGLSIQKIIHKGWEEFERATKIWAKNVNKKTGFKLTQWFGKYQYILRSDKGEISVIQIKKMNFGKGKDTWGWEIYAHENTNLFSSTMSFKTKKEAFDVAKKYLL